MKKHIKKRHKNMNRLTGAEYWNSFWDSESRLKKTQERENDRKRTLNWLIKRFFGQKSLGYMKDYSEYILWNVIYEKHMPRTKGTKVLEVGSAPGYHLIELSKRFGFDPYGVEYSRTGVDLNRELFIANNINPDNVIYCDFFSDEFHKKYMEYFDVVISKGFIEHFTNVRQVLQKHVDLLKKGGCLIVGIPNFRGLNYALLWFFNRKMISRHNIRIMRKKTFLKLYDKKTLSPLFCDYFGIFNFRLFGTKNTLKKAILGFLNRIQLALNFVFRILFNDKRMGNELFSPFLMFIGIKKD